MKCAQFVGAACGHHGPYVFYKSVKIFKHGKFKILGLGEFFFVRISPTEDPCIGEMQLLWEDKSSNQMLCSVRLYFLPEQTPEGRKSHHGEHEVVAASEKVVLRLEDLRTWMTEEVSWCHGLAAPWSRGVREAPEDGPLSARAHVLDQQHLDSLKDTRDLAEAFLREPEPTRPDNNHRIQEDPNCIPSPTCVLVLSYPRYCRYRSVLTRLNGRQNLWLKNTLVVALGGFALPFTNGKVLFCRDTFDHDGLLQNDQHCEHLAPNLKNKQPRVKKRQKEPSALRSQSPGSESNTSEESKEISVKAQVTLYEANNGRKPMCKEEQDFLQKLFKFMQDRHTPIHRVPHLGFKQIDLYFFHSCAQKLGGYDAITCKKMWKHVYDEMGGNPGSTSAATCTRRHYERLLLPFERFSNGEEDTPIPSSIPSGLLKLKNMSSMETGLTLERQDSAESCRTEDDDLKPDSPLEGEEGDYPPLGVNALPTPSDLDSMTPLQPPSMLPVKPILIDLESECRTDAVLNYQNIGQKKRIRDTAISEKERKWNEIRRKTAMARNWVNLARQLRPVKPGCALEQDQDSKLSDSVLHHLVSDYRNSPSDGFHMSYHPAYINNKHSYNSNSPAISSAKASMGQVSHRDYTSTSPNHTYQHTQQQHHYRRNLMPIKTHQVVSDDSSDSLPNGYPSSKDCRYQRRPSVIQHTEKIRSPPLPNKPMPAHLGSKLSDSVNLYPESANRILYHPDYDRRIRPMEEIAKVKGEASNFTGISRKPSTPMYTQVQQQRRQYYASMCKDKSQASMPSSKVVQMIGLEISSKRQSPSSFPTSPTPSTPAYSTCTLRLQESSPCEVQVLDLSVKAKKDDVSVQNRISLQLPEKKTSLSYSNEECLDLSVKKRKTGVLDLSDEARGIENVTPPSPVDGSSDDQDKILLMPPMKTPITSLSLLRSAASDKSHLPQKDMSNMIPPALIPIVDSKSTYLIEDEVQMCSQNVSGKPHLVSDYNPSLPQFMSPTSAYSAPASGWPQNQQSSVDSLQSNLSAYKELVDHNMFSGQFPYALAQHFYPLLYKEDANFQSFTK